MHTYYAYFLVVHECYSGSTMRGSWVTPEHSATWRVSYTQQLAAGDKNTIVPPLRALTIERVRDVALPAMESPGLLP